MVWVGILFKSNNFFVFKLLMYNITYLGDPEDFTLRKIEQNVVIPKIVRERAKYEKCAEQNKSSFNVP